MGCFWSCESSKRCLRCNCKETRDSCFINNKCRRCINAEQSFRTSTTRYQDYPSRYESTYIPTVNRSSVQVVLPQPEPKLTNIRKPSTSSITKPSKSDKSQFGRYDCKQCGRFWTSLRSWSNKYQMCKNCKNPVYPRILRETLPSDYTYTEEPKEHEIDLCQMCKQLGYNCKTYKK